MRNSAGRMASAVAGLAILSAALSPLRAGAERDVLAHSAGRISDQVNPIWVGLIEARGAPEESTALVLRERFADEKWMELPRIPARVWAVTNHSSEAVVLLKPASGRPRQWAWFSSRYSFGPPLPENAEILAMAGDRKSLWALGRGAATSGGGASTSPATRAVRPVLYLLAAEAWSAQAAEWPAEIEVASQDDVSMAIIGERPTIAALGGDELIHVHQLEKNTWVRVEKLKAEPAPPRHFKLLSLGDRAAVWCQGEKPEEAVGGIWLRDNRYVKLSLSGPPPRWGDVDVTVVGDQIRLFFKRDGRLLEQRYGFDGAPSGHANELRPIKLRAEGQVDNWVMIAVMAIVTILILNVLMRRRTTTREDNRSDGDE